MEIGERSRARGRGLDQPTGPWAGSAGVPPAPAPAGAERGRAIRLRRTRSQTGVAAFCSLAFAALCGLVLAACTPGAYPVDLFAEMHYQPSQRLLEPDRRAPPPDAVPVTGRGPALTFDQAKALQNPLPRNQQTADKGAQVFKVNCAMCHGDTGRGNSVIATRFTESRAVPPVDFTSARVRGRSDGELYWIVTNGLGNMPAFGNLLTDDERWAVIQAVRGFQ